MLRLFFLVALLLPVTVTAARAADPWIGTYTYVEYGGRTAGGTGIVVTHEVSVTATAGALAATIEANGYQSQVDIVATAAPVGNRLVIRFLRDGPGQMFKDRYKAGDVLLEFERRGARTFLTHWRAYTPATRERFRNPGTYFTRDRKAGENVPPGAGPCIRSYCPSARASP